MRKAKGLTYYKPGDYVRRFLWAAIQPVWRLSPRYLWWARNALIRCFGGDVGKGVRIYPAAKIIQPWNFSIGSNSVIAWNATVYCLGKVRIGDGVVISQGSHLCAGSHDISDNNFKLTRSPICIEDNVWIAAEAFIGPNISVGRNSIVGARSVVMRSVPPGVIVAGNPARQLRSRTEAASR